MLRGCVRVLIVAVTLYAASEPSRTTNRPIAVLLTGRNAQVTQGAKMQQPVHTAEGDLIWARANMIAGGERVRFLYLSNGFIYEYRPGTTAFPAPSSAVESGPDFDISFERSEPRPKRGSIVQTGRVPIENADPTHVVSPETADPQAAAALPLIETELRSPGDRQTALRLAKAIALEKVKKFSEARGEYAALSRVWTGAAWLKKKAPDLIAAERLMNERASADRRPQRTLAVVVGISKYQRLTSATYADSDAALFSAYLTAPGRLAPEDVVLLSDDAATKDAVADALRNVINRRAGPRDTVLVFFAGQGMSETDVDGEHGFLLTYDSDPQEKSTSAYPISELRRLVAADPSGPRVIFLGDLARTLDYQGAPNRISEVAPIELQDSRISGILASSPKELSLSLPAGVDGQGVFTFTLLKGLNLASDLFPFVSENVRTATGNKQHPLVFGSFPGQLVLRAPAARRATRPRTLLALLKAPGEFFAGLMAGPASDQRDDTPPDTLKLQEQGQQILLEYLRGNEQPPAAADFARGLERYTAASRLNPDPSVEARRLFFEGWVRGFAIAPLEEAVRLEPTAGYAHNALGIAYLKIGSYQRAAWSFRDAIARAPHWIYPRHNLALTYMAAGAYSAAEKEYREALALEEQTATLHYGFALLLQQTNRLKEAGREYERALQIDPKLAEAHTALGTVLAAQGNPEGAMAQYSQALSLKPGLAAARHDLGLLFAKQHREDEAIRLWEANVAEHPEFIHSRLSLAGAYAVQRRFLEAIGQYEAVLQLAPDHAGARRALLETRGDSAAANGNRKAATAEYEEALKLAFADEDRKRLKAKLEKAQK